MSFIEFLQTQDVIQNDPGLTSTIIDEINDIASGHDDYRTLSLVFADISELRDVFESLWYEYETELDRQEYESVTRKSKFVPVQDVIGRILSNLKRRQQM